MTSSLKNFKIILLIVVISSLTVRAEPEFFYLDGKSAETSVIEKISAATDWNEVKSLLNMAESYFAQNPKISGAFLENVYNSARKISKNKSDRLLADQRLKIFSEKHWEINKTKELLSFAQTLDADSQISAALEVFDDSAVAKWNQVYIAASRMQKSGNKDSELFYILGKSQFRMSFSGKEDLKEFIARAPKNSLYSVEAQSLLKSIEINEQN